MAEVSSSSSPVSRQILVFLIKDTLIDFALPSLALTVHEIADVSSLAVTKNSVSSHGLLAHVTPEDTTVSIPILL